MKSRFIKTTSLFFLLIAMDYLALYLSLHLAFYFRNEVFVDLLLLETIDDIRKYFWILIISIALLLYENIYLIRHDFWGDAKKVIKALVLSSLLVFTVLTLTKISAEYSIGLILLFFIFSIFILLIFKRFSKRLLFSSDFFKIKVKLIAKGEKYEILSNELNKNWYFGFIHNDKEYEMVIIAAKSFDIVELQKLIKEHAQKTKDIYVIPYMDHLDFSHASIMDYSNIRLSAIHLENRLLNYKNTIVKYIFEKSLVLLIFPFTLVLHVFISLLIKLDSNGKVIYKQKRLGKGEKKFSCYKYRTMFENQEDLKKYLDENPDEVEYYQEYHKYKNDPRITRVGKFLRKTSLDEFPQFYNILRGDMNLIGPRPYMINEEKKIGKINKEVILKVNPGITGLWQVSGRNELSFEQRLELDTWYIQNWSLWMDFVIFLKTIKVVLLKVGAR